MVIAFNAILLKKCYPLDLLIYVNKKACVRKQCVKNDV